MAQITTEYILQIDEFEVQVIRKNIKNMYLRVVGTNPVLQISAPLCIPDEDIFRFIRSRREWILAGQKRIQEEQHRKQEMEGLESVSQEQQKQEEWKQWTYLKEELTKLLEKWAPVMDVRPAGFKIRKMKSRWGSCNVRTHHMTFNLELARVPYECMEYVVVHELTHLLEPSHNTRFWNLMEYYLPGAKQLRKQLKDCTD